ncbi:MAG: DUF2088 domain-containing protein [Firmicutes bacterium]|nr:DUF2088 domain-containing protein [Bacillota bacterium]
MGTVANLLKDVPVPRMLPIEQTFDDTHIPVEEIPAVVRAEMERDKIKARFKPGMRVSITAGSRGINNIALIIKSIVDVLKDWGCDPFIVPAMGSHGGATPEGQAQMIAGYGVTEEAMGCPIISSMETVVCGYHELGGEVRMDKHAYESDAIVLVNRIKTHTAFRGPYESGLMKMMAIGLGKQPGAQIVHQEGFKEAHILIPRYGKVILHNSPVAFGMGIIENAYDQTMELHALDKDEIEEEEPKLLAHSRPYMPKLLFDSCDVLIVDKIGKDISGDGMDPNVTGRFAVPYASGGIDAQRVAVLDLTDGTHGNACGCGLADVTTRRLFEKMDFEAIYPNTITNTVTGEMKIPMVMDTDKLAVQLCLKTCNYIDRANPRVIRIKDSNHVKHIMISEAMLEEAKNTPGITVLGEPEPMKFNDQDNFF